MHKKINVFFLIALILLLDQALKIYIKTNFELNTSRHVLGDWFQLFFVENPGMAYGMKFGGTKGKVALTLFRMAAVIAGTFYILKLVKRKETPMFIFCVSLIYAGALGNLIDSCFYGLIFDKGMLFDPVTQDYNHYYNGLASYTAGKGYAPFLHGNVVDMLYFPILKGHFPAWFPGWGGEDFEFFRPVFNLADASISSGVAAILIFNKKMSRQIAIKNEPENKNNTLEPNN